VGARFCSACGVALAADEAPGSRKTVSVVFCDLVGSTALGERSDPEVLRELMRRYHAELRAILERHGGSVEKFVGDAAMAVFGVPRVHEDDALRAVRAAVEMRDAVGPLGLEVRIGVNTGEVVAGAGETLVTGDAINVAARLEQAAMGGEILIGEATEQLVRDAVRTESVEPLRLKGKSEPVTAFRVAEVVAGAPAFTRRIDAPFVGRGRELETLEAAFAAAVERRVAQLATIVGPPGIGKSRLARELLQRIDARVLVGRCLSYGEGITYWPLAEIVSQLGDLGLVLRGEEADLAAYRIGAALGTVESSVSPEEIAWGFRKLLEALARERPLIVVVDDIHWAEPALLDLIESIATFAQDAPLLLLCMARGELFEQRPSWTAPRPNATLVTLEPLFGDEVEWLVEQLGSLSGAVKGRIVEAAEGNPLFVEQLVAMRAESGDEEFEIPPTLQALLAARIDRLADEERAVVARGSVEGRLFHRSAVAELLPEADRAQVGSHLLTLIRKELIRPDVATVPGDDGFRFGHILLRDAAYEAVPKRQRADLHERYADWLAGRLGAQAPAELVGYHLERAYRYRAELGLADPALGERAAERLRAAALAARGRQDVAAQVNLLSRASEILPGGRLRPLVLAELGIALHEAADPEGATHAFEDAALLARETGDPHAEWLARVELAYLRIVREPEGAADDVLREAHAAIAACEPAGDHQVVARAWRTIGMTHLLRSQAVEQGRALEQARRHAREAGDVALEVECVLSSAPPILFGPVPVTEALPQVEAMCEGLGDVPAIDGFVLHVLGHLRARLGDAEGAIEAISEWRVRFRELGQEMSYIRTSACVYDVCFWAGDWAQGERALREAYEALERTGDKSSLSTVAAQLGDALLRQGQLDEALRYSHVSEEIGATDDLLNESKWRTLRAQVLAASGEFERAEQLAREAIEIAAGSDYFELVAEAWLGLGEVLRGSRRDGAEEAARQALTRFEQKGNLVGASRARALLEEAAPRKT
jgi:class 3 adenylate cyclase/tetratricopeptide (TPR) repeat protein